MKRQSVKEEPRYAVVSVARFDSGINLRYKKKTNIEGIIGRSNSEVYKILVDAIHLTMELFHCQTNIPANVVANIKANAVYVSESVSITTKIDYFEGHTLFTMYLQIKENIDDGIGLFWRFPVKSKSAFVLNSDII